MLAGMKLLLAEDDATLSDALSARLHDAGFEVDVAADGATAQTRLLQEGYVLGIIDLGLPEVDGLTVLRRVRAHHPGLPLMILTALDAVEDRVAGLNAGADDYLTKPFEFPELEARIRSLLRRSQGVAGPVQHLGRLVVDRAGRRALVEGQALELSPREWGLLDLLVSQHGKVVTKDQIAEGWELDRADAGPSSIEVYIHRLRRKLLDSGLTIRTVRGLGYLLEPA